MFVGGTFLSSLDRLSVKSILTGKTGTVVGVLGSALFIAICFIIFLNPVIYYFRGDYIQGIFDISKTQDMKVYSGCDYKMAVSFYSKSTGQLVNLNQTTQLFDSQVFYTSPDQDTFYASVQPCSPQYFVQMENKPHQFNPEDCYIFPNGLGYFTQYIKGFTSVIGFKFTPKCDDPLMCTYNSSVNEQLNKKRQEFFLKHFYILMFSGNQLDQFGKLNKKFYKLYSTQWQLPNTPYYHLWAVSETTRVYLDNSIMPWINNETMLFPSWYGLTQGKPLSQYGYQQSGAGLFYAISNNQRIFFRQYKKLDWLLGMLGGGILMLFIIFWTVFNFISTLKQKYQTCISTTLVRYTNDKIDQIYKPNFSVLWFISNILPWNLSYFKSQNQILAASQKMIDLSELIKKLKTATKNLKKFHYPTQFQPKIIDLYQQRNNQTFSQQELKYQINSQTLQQIRKNKNITKIYSNHLPMLALYNQPQKQTVNKQIQQILSSEVYSKSKVPKFQLKQKKTIRRFCKGFTNYLQKFILLFDVFGAKPNFCGRPQSYSIFGCVLTLIIIGLSILTFVLTLKNMGVTRTYLDQIYVNPQNQNLQFMSGRDFRFAICFDSGAFTNNLVLGQDRVVNIKFYQYKRNGFDQSYTYSDVYPIKSDSNVYFDLTTNIYKEFNETNCFRIQNGKKFETYGNPTSQKQAYVGIKLTPRCTGTPAYCQSVKNNTINNFFNLLNVYPIYFLTPQANYYPDTKTVNINPMSYYFEPAVLNIDLNFTKSIQLTTHVESAQVIDDWASWTMGEYPKPSRNYLSVQKQTTELFYMGFESDQPYLNLKLLMNGRIKRYIFSSYKIDFLFATIGGCFAFFYFFFGCFGKAYNAYCIKEKLAAILYSEQPGGISTCKVFLNWLRIFCCNDPVIEKIQKDIDCVQVAKNVDNVYRLSVTPFQNNLQKNLGLIYLKQRIKQDEQVIIQKPEQQQEQQDEFDDGFQYDWNARLKRQKRKNQSNQVQVISQAQNQQALALDKQLNELRKNLDHEPTYERVPTLRSTQKCGNFLSYFDFFNNSPQFTLEGKRSVKSVCGGLCCIILFIFICVLTSHFLTVYFSDFHRISINKVTTQDTNATRMDFEVGKNFKLAVSFYKQGQYNLVDVRNLTGDIGLSLIKYKYQRTVTGGNSLMSSETIPLKQCTFDQIKKFIDQNQDPKYFKNFSLAYCVPDGVQLSLYGSTDDKVRQYFSIKLYNKYGNTSAAGLQKIKDFLANYLVQYYMSSPYIDYGSDNGVRYGFHPFSKSNFYQTTTSRIYNYTLLKSIVQHDTTVYASSQRPSFSTYSLRSSQAHQVNLGFIDDVDRYSQLNFYAEAMYNQYVIKKLKANQIFGIIGGCVALLFFGIGVIPRSYNQFKLRYKLGTKLYMILGKKRIVRVKNTRGKQIQQKNTDQDYSQLSQWRLVLAWIMSFWGFIKSDYNSFKTLRHAALIQSRASKDMNVFEFMKTLRGLEKGIKKMELLQRSDLNLCRVYAKQIVPMVRDQGNELGKQLIKQIKDHHQDLIDATRVNKFTEWQLSIILKAKQQNLDITKVFTQKWLDPYMGINRSSMGSSAGRTTNNRTLSFKKQYTSKKQSKMSRLDEQRSDNNIILDKQVQINEKKSSKKGVKQAVAESHQFINRSDDEGKQRNEL